MGLGMTPTVRVNVGLSGCMMAVMALGSDLSLFFLCAYDMICLFEFLCLLRSCHCSLMTLFCKSGNSVFIFQAWYIHLRPQISDQLYTKNISLKILLFDIENKLVGIKEHYGAVGPHAFPGMNSLALMVTHFLQQELFLLGLEKLIPWEF